MDKQKQINEIADIIFEALNNKGRIANGEGVDIISAAIYNAGYRKIDKNAVVLTREEYDELCCSIGVSREEVDRVVDIVETRTRKETAKKFAEMFKANLIASYVIDDDCELEELEFDGATIKECIDETCKKIAEDKV